MLPTSAALSHIDVRPITAHETYAIRGTVLRPGLPLTEAQFPGDHDAATTHFGAYSDECLVGIASIYRASPPGTIDPGAWRLRGMATLPEVRGGGFGKALVDACVRHVRVQGGNQLWCNARTGAAGFYRNLGFQTIGDEFDIPTVGPHYVMSKPVP